MYCAQICSKSRLLKSIFLVCCKTAKCGIMFNLYDGEYHKEGCQDFEVRPLRVQVEKAEKDGAGVEAAADTVELKQKSKY